GFLLWPLGAVLRTALAAVGDTGGVERAANDVVADAGKILDAAAADHDDRVLLKIVTLAGNVRGHFHLVGQPHAGDLAQRRVRLLWRRRVDAHADAAALRTGHQRRRRGLASLRLAAEFHELVDGGHCFRKTSSFRTVPPAVG